MASPSKPTANPAAGISSINPAADLATKDVAITVDQDDAASRTDSQASLFTDMPEELKPLTGWRQKQLEPSLPEAHSTMRVPNMNAGCFKKLIAFSGLGFIIAIGYMDPGNWATDMSGGAKFGYTLLFVILLANLAAMFLQHLALKLGVAADRDLAQACRDAYPKAVNYALWVLAEVAIAACDLAEVIGSAVAIKLLSGLPLWAGVLITAADVVVVLLFEMRSFRLLELFILALIIVIFVCFCIEMSISKPNWADVAYGLVPKPEILTNPEMLYVAIGILGATVMPHNLYLHSGVIQTRAYPRTTEGRRYAICYGTIDSTISLAFAFLINASILILAAAAFHFAKTPQEGDVADIQVAYRLLEPALGAKAASILFAVALLASGQSSTVTATLAGQIVMEGFLQMKVKPWVRRLITRGIAIVPAIVVSALLGDAAVGRLLLLSQVILSLQLSFAVVPLVHFTSSKAHMGPFASGKFGTVAAVLLAAFIAGLNVYLLVSVGRSGELVTGK